MTGTPRPLLFGIVLAACAQPAPEAAEPAAPAVDTAAVLAGVADMWARWAVADTAGDVAALVGLIEEDARLDIKGMPAVLGRAAAEAVMAGAFEQMDYVEASVAPTMTVALSNDLAHQAGTYMERYTAKGQTGEMTDYGRYAVALVRGADGQWRWGYMMAFADSTVTRK